MFLKALSCKSDVEKLMTMNDKSEQALDIVAIDDSGVIWRAMLTVTLDKPTNMVIGYETRLIQAIEPPPVAALQ